VINWTVPVRTPVRLTLMDRDEPSMDSPREAYDTLINRDEELSERDAGISHNLFLVQTEEENC
jgi:hypothetical protein